LRVGLRDGVVEVPLAQRLPVDIANLISNELHDRVRHQPSQIMTTRVKLTNQNRYLATQQYAAA